MYVLPPSECVLTCWYAVAHWRRDTRVAKTLHQRRLAHLTRRTVVFLKDNRNIDLYKLCNITTYKTQNIQGGPIKTVHFKISCFFLQVRTDFQNSFTRWFVRKFCMYISQRFTTHLQYVATLPCEGRKSKNVTKFSRWTWQLMFN